MGDIIFGESSTPSQVVDTTAQPYVNLRDTVARQLTNAIQYRGLQPQIYNGPYAAQLTGAEQQGLQGVQQAAGQVGQQGVGQQALALQAGGQFNPFAGLTGLEQYGLGQVAGQAFGPNPNQQLAQQVLGQQIGGQFNPFAQAAGLTGAEQAGLNAIQQTAFGQNPLTTTVNQQLGQIAGTGVHPQLNALIEAAQRPILQNFEDQALAARGLYTGAGQQVQGQGSSPFAQASARLSGNVASALGDVATNVTAQLNQQQQQAQLAALGLAQQQPGIQLGNQIAGLGAVGLPRELQQLGLNLQNQAFTQQQGQQLQAAGLSDQLSGNALTRALQGLGAAGLPQERGGAAFENAANRQLQAGGQLAGQDLAGQQAQLQAQLQNLQAQGLPRMIEQLGIEGGLAEYQRQQQMLQQLLGLAGGLSTGQQVVLPGVSGTPGLAQSFVGGLGQGIGSGITFGASDRRVKKDVQSAGAIGDVPLYRYRYLWEDDNAPLRIGVMADEVTHIPGAVHDIGGIAHVNYNRVIDHLMEPAHA